MPVSAAAVSLGTAWFLGSRYGKADENVLMLSGNFIFCILLLFLRGFISRLSGKAPDSGS